MKILLTGATGFIGKNLVENLTSKNYNVRCFIREKNFYNEKVEIVRGDILNKKDIDNAVKGVTHIVHLAAIINSNNPNIFKVNVEGTKLLLGYAKKYKVKKFIFISTENVSLGFKDNYAITKKLAEEEVKKFKNNVILRPTIVYGPGDRRYISILIKVAKKYPIIPIMGPGKNLVQPLYVEDLAKVIENCIKYNIKGIHIVVGPSIVDYNKIVSIILNKLRVKRLVIHIPLFILKPVVYLYNLVSKDPIIRTTQLRNINVNRINKVNKSLKNTPIPIEEGISLTIFKENL